MLTCRVCQGTGKLLQDVCPLCDGDFHAFISQEAPSMPPSSFTSCVLELPEVAQALYAASCDPEALTRLGSTARNLHAFTSSPVLVNVIVEQLRAHCAWIVPSCETLEEVALGIAVWTIVCRATKNHLYFPYGGGTDVRTICRPLLDDTAALARRFRKLQVHIDSHVGRGAPPGIARSCSLRRGHGVADELVRRGVASKRITLRAWGKRVTARWGEPEDDKAARAEMFWRLGESEFPPHEAYYDLVPEEERPTTGHIDSSASASEDEAANGPPLRGRFVQLPAGQVLPVELLRLLIARQLEADDEGTDGDLELSE